MARPRLERGEIGDIATTEQPDGRHRARCKFRGYDGKMKSAEALGPSKTAAQKALRKRVERRLGHTDTVFNSESLFRVAAEKWWHRIEERAALNPSHKEYLNPDTRIEYQRYYQYVVDVFGDFQLFDCTVGALETGLKSYTDNARVYNEMRRTLKGIMALAVRLGAIEHNPALSVEAALVASKQARALTVEEHKVIRGRIMRYENTGGAAAPRAAEKGRGGRPRAVYLLDMFDLQLALMCRIGEVLALQWDKDIEGLDDGDSDVIVWINATLKHRSKAEAERTGLPVGLYRQEHPKTTAGNRKLVLGPHEHVVTVLRRLREEQADGVPWVFATSKGTPRSPSNARTALRKARGEEFDWFTPHTLRRTGITSALVAGEQLEAVSKAAGHARFITTEGYTDKTQLPDISSAGRDRFGPAA